MSLEGRLARAEKQLAMERSERKEYSHAQLVKMAGYVRARYRVELPDEELLYVMVHVNRLRRRDAPVP